MKLDRLIGILTVLLQNDRVTASYLSEKFEVTRRTIGRDIDALCRAGIPVATHQGGGGGISITEGYKLDKSVLTSDELSDIIAALKGIGSVSETPQIERILDKLYTNKDTMVSLHEHIIIDLSSHYKGSLTAKIKLIKDSIREQRLIEFDYYYEKGTVHRRIEPYFIIFQWAAWYVFGYCTERQDWRLFKLTRLWEPALCDETYCLRDIPPEKRDFNAGFKDDKFFTAVFDPEVKYQLIESYGLHCFTETPDGKLRLEMSYTNRDYIIQWLLSFGHRSKVLEPTDLAEEIKNIAEKIIEAYK